VRQPSPTSCKRQAAANAITWVETISRGTYVYRVRAFNGTTAEPCVLRCRSG
jgi:hypothetical protein